MHSKAFDPLGLATDLTLYIHGSDIRCAARARNTCYNPADDPYAAAGDTGMAVTNCSSEYTEMVDKEDNRIICAA